MSTSEDYTPVIDPGGRLWVRCHDCGDHVELPPGKSVSHICSGDSRDRLQEWSKPQEKPMTMLNRIGRAVRESLSFLITTIVLACLACGLWVVLRG